jgi:hypothetical protein
MADFVAGCIYFGSVQLQHVQSAQTLSSKAFYFLHCHWISGPNVMLKLDKNVFGL